MHVYRNITNTKLTDVNKVAPQLENMGYNGLLMTELKHDPFLPLAVAATSTEAVTLATGIAISFLRSPMAIANIAWDLNEATSGRFTLGLGTDRKSVV